VASENSLPMALQICTSILQETAYHLIPQRDIAIRHGAVSSVNHRRSLSILLAKSMLAGKSTTYLSMPKISKFVIQIQPLNSCSNCSSDKCARHSSPSNGHASDRTTHLIFHNGSMCHIPRGALAGHDRNGLSTQRSYGALDSSSA
jgi:hypothetical protein